MLFEESWNSRPVATGGEEVERRIRPTLAPERTAARRQPSSIRAVLVLQRLTGYLLVRFGMVFPYRYPRSSQVGNQDGLKMRVGWTHKHRSVYSHSEYSRSEQLQPDLHTSSR